MNESDTVKEPHWSLRFLPALLWPLLLWTCCLELHLRSDWYAPYLFERLHVVESVADAEVLHAAVYETLFHGAEINNDRFTTAEQQHFKDVASLLQLNRYLAIASFLLLLVFSLKHRLRWYWMRLGALYVLGLTVGLILLSTRWLILFRGLHPLLFSHDDWDFHPDQTIVQLYPELLLAVLASAVVITVLFCAVGIFFLGQRFDKQPLFAGCYWNWHKRLGDSALALGLFAIPIWITGRDMMLPDSFSWQLYYVLFVFVLVGSCLLMTLRNTALSVLIVGCSFLWLQVFSEGVANSTARAQYNLEVNGQKINEALAAYKQQHGSLPNALSDLTEGGFLQDVRLGLPGPHAWKLKRFQDGSYMIHFTGPLSFEFSYHSKNEFWNAMHRP